MNMRPMAALIAGVDNDAKALDLETPHDDINLHRVGLSRQTTHEAPRRGYPSQAITVSMTRLVSSGSRTWMQVTPVERAG